jgi:hypothetical protein
MKYEARAQQRAVKPLKKKGMAVMMEAMCILQLKLGNRLYGSHVYHFHSNGDLYCGLLGYDALQFLDAC